MSTILGLDIGGANLKAAHSSGGSTLQPFALWKNPNGLPQALRALLTRLPPPDRLAVTMTGELCDCYDTKREGVLAILDAVEAVAEGRPIAVWRNDGCFVTLVEARNRPLLVAAANWLALATFACRFAPIGPALLIDIGSTTTDIIPLRDGIPTPTGRTDPERLRSSELVYLGIRRTPLCALSDQVAAELFATTLDVFLLTGMYPENPSDCGSADSRPATRAAAHARMARMLCADVETYSLDEAKEMASRILARLVSLLGSAIYRVVKQMPAPPETVILAGSGEFLGRLLLKQDDCHVEFTPRQVVALAEQIGSDGSAAGCAFAVALLAKERKT